METTTYWPYIVERMLTDSLALFLFSCALLVLHFRKLNVLVARR